MKQNFTEQVLAALKLGIESCGSAAELSRRTGVSNANISRWLKGMPPKTGEIAPVCVSSNSSCQRPRMGTVAGTAFPVRMVLAMMESRLKTK